jgi:signal transduction histidine kinase
MTAMLAGLITYVTWSFAFDNYIRRNLQYSAEYVAQHAAQAYSTFDGWDFSYQALIPKVFPREDGIVQIFDSEGRLVYDEIAYASLTSPYTRSDFLARSTKELSPNNGDVIVVPIVVDYRQGGEVRICACGPTGFLTPHDLEMRATSLTALGIAGVIAVILSTLLGVVTSRRMVKPILQVTEAARRLRDGDETARTGLKGEGEVSQLGFVFDRMADVIQHDRERERRMTSGVAHELRTPLMGIQATVEAIEDGIYPADSKHLSIITEETKRLKHLTDSLLELSRLENEKEAFPLSLIDLNEPVDAVLAVNQARIERAGLSTEVDLTPELMVKANAARLQQAVTNLIVNAIRYTPKGGTLSVHSYADGRWVRLVISDTGIGMSEDDLVHAFSRFWRADEARARTTGGTGIGLPIAREIIDRHHGTIEVESNKGQGATFTISLPKASGGGLPSGTE